MDYGAALEMRFGATRRGFESRPLRQPPDMLTPHPSVVTNGSDLPTVVGFELGTFRFPEPELAGRRGVVMGYVIHHREGILLFDTGFGFGEPEVDRQYDVKARRIADALSGVEVAMADVTAIVNCHLHADHAGQNLAFPGVPTFVQPAEWELAHTPDHTILHWVDYPGAAVRPVSGDHEIAPGIGVVATPGHTRGHQSLSIQTAEGLVVLAGQACYTAGEWEGDDDALEGRSTAPDPAAYDCSIERLRALRPARVLFGHDRRPWVDGRA